MNPKPAQPRGWFGVSVLLWVRRCGGWHSVLGLVETELAVRGTQILLNGLSVAVSFCLA